MDMKGISVLAVHYLTPLAIQLFRSRDADLCPLIWFTPFTPFMGVFVSLITSESEFNRLELCNEAQLSDIFCHLQLELGGMVGKKCFLWNMNLHSKYIIIFYVPLLCIMQNDTFLNILFLPCSSFRIRASYGLPLRRKLPCFLTRPSRHVAPTDQMRTKTTAAIPTCSSPYTSTSTAWRRAGRVEVSLVFVLRRTAKWYAWKPLHGVNRLYSI